MSDTSGCSICGDGDGLDFDITMAFQPIVDVGARAIFAHEALVRGTDGAGAGAILARVTKANRYTFDQTCRVTAIELAARLNLPGLLSINFLPNAVYQPENCIKATLEAAGRTGFPTDRIIFEITEGEEVVDRDHLIGIIREYQRQGFTTAIDDFGAGYSGLNLLSEFQPDVIKLDRELIKSIHDNLPRQAILTGVLSTCKALGIRVIAEGVEEPEEYAYLRDQGLTLFQGYLFARPAFEQAADTDAINWP